MPRRRLWEVSPCYLCPLVGTCLPVSLLRRLARRARLQAADGISDYDLHHAAVHLAAQRNEFSRLAQKELDARHAAAVARFTGASEEPALLELWKAGLEIGDVAGPLWALMTHPLASPSLQQLASQDIHMLSHQVGASSRADLRRLAALESDNRTLREALEEQRCRSAAQLAAKEERIAALERRLADAEGSRLRLEDAERNLRRLQDARAPDDGLVRRLAQSEARCTRLERMLVELRTAQESFSSPSGREPVSLEPNDADGLDLSGRRVLYVGGRTGLVEHYRRLVQRHGGALLHHDGGLEDSLHRLQPLLAAADLVVCAAGETSHAAYYVVKRFCKHAGKPCTLVRRPSLAALAKSLRAFQRGDTALGTGDTLLRPAA